MKGYEERPKIPEYPQGLTEKESDLLSEFGLKSCRLSGAPTWLCKYASLICEYLMFEEQMYPRESQQSVQLSSEHKSKTNHQLKGEAKSIR